jgi:curved DNA-binding protein CbpA
MTAATCVDLDLGRSLADCELGGHSGILTAVRGKLKRQFCVEQGLLIFAASNVIEEQFSEFLIREELISAGELVAVQQADGQSGVGLARQLLRERVLDEEVLIAAQERHVRELLFATLDWSDGQSNLARGQPDLQDEVTPRVRCAPLLLDYARERPASLADVRARIGSRSARLVVRDDRADLLDGLPSAVCTQEILARCDGTKSVDDLVAGRADDEEARWRSLYALLLLGIVEPSTAPGEDAFPREEIVALLARAENADYYTVLGLGPSANDHKIRESYYVLARRYHPDRFRAGPLEDLRERVEGYFAKVTEAYNTLDNPRLRAAYDEQQKADTSREPEQDTAYLARENFRRGKALMAKGRLRDAATSLENAVQLDGRNATYRLELGQLLARNPRLRRQAEQHLVEVNRIDPSLAEGYLALGDLYLKSNRKDDAIRLFREVLRWEPGHLEATARLQELGIR